MLNRIASLPPTHTSLAHPPKTRQKHQRRRRPRKRHKLISPMCLQPNLLAILINHLHPLNTDGRYQSTRNAHGQKRQCRKDDGTARAQSPLGENGWQRCYQCEEYQPDGNAVQHEDSRLQNMQRVDAALDIIRPVQVVQRNGQLTLVQLLLDDLFGLEVEGGFHVGAIRNIALDVAFVERGVGQRARLVHAEAVVEDVDRVEVVDAEGARRVADEFLDGIGEGVGDGSGDVLDVWGEQVEDGAAFFEDVVAYAGGVELRREEVSGCVRVRVL